MLYFTVLAVTLCGISAVAVAGKFHIMQRHIPRNDFVKLEKSEKTQLHELVFAIKQKNLADLDRMLTDRSTPGSALYQQWLTHGEIGDITRNNAGASAVVDWLEESNVVITYATARQEYIKATATISEWEKLLNTQFYLWEDHSRDVGLNSNNRFIHRAEEYSLPAAIKPHLSAVFNTVQVPPVFKPRYHKKDAKFRTDLTITPVVVPHPDALTMVDGKVTVAFLNQFYQITSNTGNPMMQQSVFETAEESYSPVDLTTFQKNFSLPIQAALHPYGYNTTACTFNTCGEGNLDVQYIMGVAQQTATIYWYVTDNSTTDPFVAWLVDVANTTSPPLANSMSWGSIEQANSPDVMDAFNTEALKLAAMGVTITVSSGDDGVASDPVLCNANSASTQSSWPYPTTWTGKGYFPSFPATSPYVTAVGATMGPESGNPEITCQSQLGGVITSGGGFSTYYPQPAWQAAAVGNYFEHLPTGQVPTTGYNVLGRAYPDVALVGAKYQVVIQNVMENVYGTSCSSPVFAAFVSLANAARATAGKVPLGFLNPTLWAYGTENAFGPDGTTYNPYNDVTSGNNKCVSYSGPNPSLAHCCASGFYAAPGWDPTTGFGSVNYTSLVTMFDIGIPAPSAEPSAAPTIAATVRPTTTVTARPSSAPNAAPTPSPVITTPAPTMAPSAPPSPIISFTSNITLAGLTSPILDAASQNCVIETTAEAMGLPYPAVHYAGTVVLSATAVDPAFAAISDPRITTQERRLRGSDVPERIHDRQEEPLDLFGLQSTYSVIAITYTEVYLSETLYTSPSALYDGVTSLLSTSVSTGAYTTQLRVNAASFNSSVLATADATGESSSPPTIISADSSGGGGNDDLSLGIIIGIAVGGFAVVAILCGVALYFMSRPKQAVQTDTRDSFAPPESSPTKNPVLAGHQSPTPDL